MQNLHHLMTTPQAALFLGIQPSTLEKARSTGMGNYPPFYKIGRLVKYQHSDLVAWLYTTRHDNNMGIL